MADLTRHAVGPSFRFGLSLRDVDEMLAARKTEVFYEKIRRRERQWQRFKSQASAQRIFITHSANYNALSVQHHLTSRPPVGFFRAEVDAARAAAVV